MLRRLWILLVIFSITFPIASAYEDTSIQVSIVGDTVIHLDSPQPLVRAYVDVSNYDPSEGSYLMKIIQSSTGAVISEQEILVRETGNDRAGVNVAYLVNIDDLNFNGSKIHGSYDIVIKPEFGDSMGQASFSIEGSEESFISNFQSKTSNADTKSSPDAVPLSENMSSSEANLDDQNENKELKPELDASEKNIPEWVRGVFLMYANGSISESELLNALKFLIEQEILLI